MISNKVDEILRCINNSSFDHYARDPINLSCGHSICKSCIPTNKNEKLKCFICGL